MEDFVLKTNELQELRAYVGKIPTDYGHPILLFIMEMQARRKKEAEEDAKKAPTLNE